MALVCYSVAGKLYIQMNLLINGLFFSSRSEALNLDIFLCSLASVPMLSSLVKFPCFSLFSLFFDSDLPIIMI